jgi:hypothetical protein
MPDSFGKRQRDQVKARKAAARDERRVARNKRRKGGPQTEPSPEGALHDAGAPAAAGSDLSIQD